MKSLDEISDCLNPLLVKEVRQMFHSTIYLVVMGLFLLAELAVLFFMMLSYRDMHASTKNELGLIAFVFQCIGMSLAVLVVCVFRTCITFNKERMDSNLDYTKLCTMTPFSVVWGKLSSAILLMLVIVSLITPFMAISYFLKGISIQTMLVWMLILIPEYILAIQFAILAGSVGKKGAEVIMLVLICQVIPQIIGAVAVASGHGSKIEMVAVMLAAASLTVFMLCFSWTVALISRSKSDIMFFPRLCVYIINIALPIVFVGLLFAFGGAASSTMKDGIIAISVLQLISTGTLMLAFVMERAEPGRRVLAERPVKKLLRAIKFFLASGRAGGIASACVLLIINFLTMILLSLGAATMDIDLLRPLGCALFVMLYSLLAVTISRYLKKLHPVISLVIVVLVLFALPVIILSLYAMSAKINDGEFVLGLSFTSPLFVFAEDSLFKGVPNMLISPGIPLVIVIGLNLPYLVRSFKTFVWEEQEASK